MALFITGLNLMKFPTFCRVLSKFIQIHFLYLLLKNKYININN